MSNAGSKFQSTPSVWRETAAGRTAAGNFDISIHSLRMEGDRFLQWISRYCNYFNPLPPYGGRPARRFDLMQNGGISIHSLRMEGDGDDQLLAMMKYLFQSTPSVWRETQLEVKVEQDRPFQSTPSVWRETPEKVEGVRKWHFNPLPPYGGRPQNEDLVNTQRGISIHSLRMEGDCELECEELCYRAFQSTPSVWRETRKEDEA